MCWNPQKDAAEEPLDLFRKSIYARARKTLLFRSHLTFRRLTCRLKVWRTFHSVIFPACRPPTNQVFLQRIMYLSLGERLSEWSLCYPECRARSNCLCTESSNPLIVNIAPSKLCVLGIPMVTPRRNSGVTGEWIYPEDGTLNMRPQMSHFTTIGITPDKDIPTSCVCRCCCLPDSQNLYADSSRLYSSQCTRFCKWKPLAQYEVH